MPITEIYVESGSTLNPWRHGFGNLGTIIAVFSVFTGLILNEIARGKEKE